MMKMVVTGGAGFIGSHLCQSLLERDKTVICIDNFDPFYDNKAKRDNIDSLSRFGKFIFYESNATDKEVMNSIFEQHKPIQQVFHMAGRGGLAQSVKDPFPYFENIVGSALTILEMCVAHDVMRFVNASTSSIYGAAQGCDDSIDVNTDEPTAPYVAFKKSSELLGHSYYHNHGIMCVNARLFSVYGPRGRPDQIIYKLARHIIEGIEFKWYEPEPIRDFTFVSDIVDGLMSTLCLPEDTYCTIDLGYGKAHNLSSVITILESELGQKLLVSPDIVAPPKYDFPYSCADIAQTSAILDWKPKIDLHQGIHEFVGWYSHINNF